MPKTITVKKFKGIDQFRRKGRWGHLEIECLMALTTHSWSSRRRSQGLFTMDTDGISRRWISSRHSDNIEITAQNHIAIGDEWELT